jgi:hypothetical protein
MADMQASMEDGPGGLAIFASVLRFFRGLWRHFGPALAPERRDPSGMDRSCAFGAPLVISKA